MVDTNNPGAATEDCPCTSPHGQAERDCPDCSGTGTIDTDAITADSFAPSEDDDGWAIELEQINAELDYFADDEAA